MHSKLCFEGNKKKNQSKNAHKNEILNAVMLNVIFQIPAERPPPNIKNILVKYCYSHRKQKMIIIMEISVNDIRTIDIQYQSREERKLCNFKFLYNH